MLKTHLKTEDLINSLSKQDEKLVSEFVTLIYDEVMSTIMLNKGTAHISVINTAINRGIIFHAKKIDRPTEMWIGLLKASVQALIGNDYRLDHGYIATSDKEKVSSRRYYVYIKPAMRLRAQVPVKQLFGNLFFDLTIENDSAIQWKLLSNVYRGRNYQEPLELVDLIHAMWVKM